MVTLNLEFPTDLKIAFQIFMSLFHEDRHLIVLPSTRRSPTKCLNNALQCKSHPWMRRGPFLMRVVKYCINLPPFVVRTKSANIFKEMLDDVWAEAFSPSPRKTAFWTEHSSSQFLTHRPSTYVSSVNTYHFLMLPYSLHYQCSFLTPALTNCSPL